MAVEGLVVATVWFACAFASGYPIICLLRTFGKRTLRLDWIELGFASALLGTLVIGWLGLLMAELGIFSLSKLVGILLAFLAGTVMALRTRRGTLRLLASIPSRPAWLILPLAVLALVVFFHPAEFILGGADAGVYVNLGANAARTGSLLIHEDGLAEVPTSLWPGLFRQMPTGAPVRYVRFPGFYLSDDVPGLVIPQFFPLHPVWVAISNGLLGLRASLYMTPLWATLGVVALVLAVNRAFDMRVGLLAASLLLVIPTQVYFARYPTSEALTQFLLWAGLYGFVAFTVDEHPLWGVLSGLALGQVFLVRIDALPVLLLPLAWLIYSLWRRSWRKQLWFSAPFAIMLLHTFLHACLFSWPYVWEVYRGVWYLGLYFVRHAWWLLISLLLATTSLLWAARRFRISLAKGGRIARCAGAVMVLGMGLFAYFVWPRTGHTVLAPYWYGGGPIPIQNHLNLVRLAWYVSPLGVWLGIAGVTLMLLEGDSRRMWPLVTTGVAFSIVYLYNIMNNPYHIYAMRRYVPVVFPFFAAGMAYALVWLWEQRQRWRAAAGIAWMLGLTLLAWLLYSNRAVWNLVEYRGLVDQVESLAMDLEPGAVLLFDDEVPVGAGATVGTPLQYLYGFTAFDLQEEMVNPEALLEGIAHWQAGGLTVYWVMGPHASTRTHASLTLSPGMGTWIDVPRLEGSYDHFPTSREEDHVPLEFYQVVGPDRKDLCDLPLRVDIGTLDSLYVRSTFHDKERWGDRTVRWTAGQAVLDLPCLPAMLPKEVALGLQVAAMRPDGFTPVHLAVEVDGKPLGEWEVGSDFQIVEVHVPGVMLQGSGHTVTLRSDTWVPQQHGSSADSRTLGVVLDWITISTATGNSLG